MTARRHNSSGGSGQAPERTCIVSRATLARECLIRFALGPDDTVTPDVAGKLPGRGAWVATTREKVAEAISKRAFDRAWRRKVTVPDDLVDHVDLLLLRRALGYLSLANKSGCVITGYTSVDQRIVAGPPPWLVQGADASVDGRERLARKYRAICKELQFEPLVIDLFSVEQISLAIGRPNVVHAAVNRERAGNEFVTAARRIMKYRMVGELEASGADQAGGVESPSE